MKKSILFLLILASILLACAPQVTVTSEVTVTLTPPPTETPIPTPTLHPQFVEIQEQIAASSGRFSLQADGTILDGAEPIPGLTVAPDGTMTLTIDSETVNLDPTDVDFDDEKGITIAGYERDEEAGAWVKAVSTPEELWQAELGEWQLNPEEYSEKKDVDGNLAVVKKSTGEVVYWVDENGVGYWNLQVMRKMIVDIVSGDDRSCLPTRWMGVKWANQRPTEDTDSFVKLFTQPFVEKIKKILPDMDVPYKHGMVVDFLGGPNNCWVIELIGYEHSVDQVEDTVMFWMNKNKNVLYAYVFSPKIKKIVLASR